MASASVAHLTCVHARYDNRIFTKMCVSLAQAGYRAHLVVADGLGDEQRDGVRITDVGRVDGGRLARMTALPKKVLQRGLALDAAIYHLHDPELLPIASSLQRAGKRVVFDSHEDVPADILTKTYIPSLLRRSVAFAYTLYERRRCRSFDAVVAATPFIRDKFLRCNPRSVDINNYPFLDEWPEASAWKDKRDEVAFVGGINGIRGIREIVDAMARLDGTRLNLAGRFNDADAEAFVRAHPGWSRVNELGFIGRDRVGEVLGRSRAGLVTFLPVPNHIDAQPNKMFEYMAAGIPVIASDFPLWRDLIEGNDCGICVDPQDPEGIARAIRRLVDEPETAKRMGENGRAAIVARYNWGSERKKLFALYDDLLR